MKIKTVKSIIKYCYENNWRNSIIALSRLLLWDTPPSERSKYLNNRRIMYKIIEKDLLSLSEEKFKKMLERFLREPAEFQDFFTKGKENGFHFELTTFERTETEIVRLLRMLEENGLIDVSKYTEFKNLDEWYLRRKKVEKSIKKDEGGTLSEPVKPEEFHELVKFAQSEKSNSFIPIFYLIKYGGLQLKEAVKISPKNIEESSLHPFFIIKVEGGKKKHNVRYAPIFAPPKEKDALREMFSNWKQVDSREITYFLERFRFKFNPTMNVKRLRIWYLYFLFSMDIPSPILALLTGIKESEGTRKYKRALQNYLIQDKHKTDYIEPELITKKKEIQWAVGESAIKTIKTLFNM